MCNENQVEEGSAVVFKFENGRNESGRLTVQPPQPKIRIGKGRVPAEVDGCACEVEVFTMRLGEEAIFLVPCKTWSQLDQYKWRVQGKLPGTPSGLEIAVDRVKIAGESVSTSDPEGCAKLERAFNDWLALEEEALEQAKQKTRAVTETPVVVPSDDDALRYQVELDKAGFAHIRCFEGKEIVANVACTIPGITSLLNEGLMRKPGAWKVGALRDWLELDGELFRFKNGNNGVAELERVLNERYHPAAECDDVQRVRVFENSASESGFDIEFPANEGGQTACRRRHLDPHAMELLSDPKRCRVLRKGILVRFTPPTFHFKQKTADGGERDLEGGPENAVSAVGADGHPKWIDLSHPLSHMGLGATELTAIFNHPSISRHLRRASDESAKSLDHAA